MCGRLDRFSVEVRVIYPYYYEVVGCHDIVC